MLLEWMLFQISLMMITYHYATSDCKASGYVTVDTIKFDFFAAKNFNEVVK